MTSHKQFIRGATLFVVYLALLMILLNIIYFDFFIQKKQLYRNEVAYRENQNHIDTLFIGSSHTKDAVNPRYIDRSFNVATGGEITYVLAYYKLRNIVEQDQTPIKNIVVEIDPHILNDRAYPRPIYIQDLWYWSDFFSYSEVAELISLSHPDYLAQSNLYFMNGARDFDIFFRKGQTSTTYRGWVANENNLSNEPDPFEYALQYFQVTFQNTNEALNPTGASYLLNIAQLAEEQDISLYLIKYPLSPEYLEVIDASDFEQAEYYAEIYDLLDEHSISYELLDYQSYYNHSSFFGDPGHLNSNTANEFSKLLNSRIYEDIHGTNETH